MSRPDPTPYAKCPNCGAEHYILVLMTGDRVWCVCQRWLTVQHRADGTTELRLWGHTYFLSEASGERTGGQG